jgi:flagellar biosynthesis/type III secretory pathway chaperone
MSDWQVVGKNPQGMEEIKESLLDQLRPIVRRDHEYQKEEALRAKFPALQSAWDNYRMVLEICRSNNPEVPEEDEEGASQL